MYDTHLYLGKHERWLDMVHPKPSDRTEEEVLDWLKVSPWGRCAWKCDNDVVDHQVVNMEFENGSTASLTMTAFDAGRGLEIFGTKASLRGGDTFKKITGSEMAIRDHATGETEMITLEELPDDGYHGHGGGDAGLMEAADAIFRGEGGEDFLIKNSIESHLIGFAAEQSRLAGGRPVEIDSM